MTTNSMKKMSNRAKKQKEMIMYFNGDIEGKLNY